jgi:hypothetical protein
LTQIETVFPPGLISSLFVFIPTDNFERFNYKIFRYSELCKTVPLDYSAVASAT